MNYITSIHKSKKKQIELAKEYAAKFKNDFVVEESSNFVLIRATRYMAQSFLNKLKKIVK